jgi:hypothetical protein
MKTLPNELRCSCDAWRQLFGVFSPHVRISAGLFLVVFFLSACSSGGIFGQFGKISDDFAFEKSLDSTHWQAGTPLLAAMAQGFSSALVEPQLTFDQSGLRMAGVNGMYQFTGVQSKRSFSPPFTVRATVMGTVANGNAFALYILSENLSQGFKLEGNVNPRGYRGLWIAHAKTSGENVFRMADVNQWYGIVVKIDARGIGTMSVTDVRGTSLATRAGWPIGGVGPFFVVLGQRAGAPLTVGPNEAVWSSVEVVPGL